MKPQQPQQQQQHDIEESYPLTAGSTNENSSPPASPIHDQDEKSAASSSSMKQETSIDEEKPMFFEKETPEDIEESSTFPTIAATHSDEKALQDASPKRRSHLMEFYCVALLGLLLFAVGLFTGHYVWEEEPSIISPISPPPTPPPAEKASIPHITVGTYYYPWHGPDFHRGDGYLRKYLEPVPQEPLLGEYDDTDPNVIAQHFEWSKRANINLWVTSWWGPDSREDITTRTVIMDHADIPKDHSIALFYETFGRVREEDNYDLKRVRSDVEYMCQQYFGHSNYYRIGDDSSSGSRPVLFVYLSRKLNDLGLLEQVVDLMREGVKDACNEDLYIVGDHIFGPTENFNGNDTPFHILDAVTNYDVYGSMGVTFDETFGGYVTEEEVFHYYQFEQRHWREIAKKRDCAYIPSVAPGYNDLGVRPEAEHVPLSRSLVNGTDGSLFQVAIQHARTLVDRQAHNILMVNSFNEWHEDSQIEPTIGTSSARPYNLTYGMDYHGYGYLYLDILRNGTQADEYYT